MLHAQVMSKKLAKSLNIPEHLVHPHKDFAQVLDVVKREKRKSTAIVKVQCFLSKGLGEHDDPICIATFGLRTVGNSELHTCDNTQNVFSYRAGRTCSVSGHGRG
jgi:hypothetical protein